MASSTSQNPTRRRGLTRLKRRREFLRAAKSGRKWVAPGLIVQARQRDGGETSADGSDGSVRVGFTVTKKVGNAVIRNRVRRRLKAVAAEILPEQAAHGQDLVIIGRMAAITRPYQALKKDLETAVGKLARAKDTGGGKRTR